MAMLLIAVLVCRNLTMFDTHRETDLDLPMIHHHITQQQTLEQRRARSIFQQSVWIHPYRNRSETDSGRRV